MMSETVTMQPSGKFWDKIAERYAKKPVADEQAYQKKLRVTREYFRPDMEVLEIGCGTGSTAITHAPHVRHIRAVDISPKMLEIAQRKADAAGIDNVTFEQSTIEGLAGDDGSYDVVLALSVLHLLESRRDAIAKVYRMLKPGGVFVTSTVCIGDKMKFFKLIAPIGKFLGLMPLVKVITHEELEQSLSEGGFDIVYRWHKGMAWFMIGKKPPS